MTMRECAAASIPRRSAAPYPTFIGTVMTRAPCAAAAAAVPSVLPSSMTMISASRPSLCTTRRRDSSTDGIAASSLCAGITKVRPLSAMGVTAPARDGGLAPRCTAVAVAPRARRSNIPRRTAGATRRGS